MNISSSIIKMNVFILFMLLFCLSPLLGVAAICIFSPFLSQLERNIASVVVVFFSILFYATLQPFGDLAEYLHVYNNINNIDIFHYTRFGKGIEFFILVIMKVVYFLAEDNQFAFLITVYTLIFTLLIFVCKKMTKDFYLLLFFSVFFSYGFVQANSYFIRQILSMLFVFMLIVEWNKKSIVYGFLSIISHTSAIMPIGLMFIKYINQFKKALYVIIPALIVGLLLLYHIGFYDYIFSKLISANIKFSTLKTSQIIIYNSQFVFIFYLLYVYRNKLNKEANSIFLITFGLFSFALFWGFINIPAMSNRFALFMCAFPGLLLYPLLSGDINFKSKYLILISIVSINLIPALYLIYNVALMGSNLNFLGFKLIQSDIFDLLTLIVNRITEELPYLTQGN
ncbi:hypothetical protein C0W81_09120 [Photobacterium aquimaris]|uniref:EpsG family protein n=1 Tax=Photobacterium aquimaris TaxID=512643 RepID=A0A2T3HYC2_9GAMM|nr:EpsG family protein [Photobacterium aquimaris]PSU04883.1 hypothetical protein C0W81_09120 [Photobacterium aquimaris]